MRDQLLTDIGHLRSQESATTWARRALAGKNRLTSQHAKLVEEAFEEKVSQLSASESADRLTADSSKGSEAAAQELGTSNKTNPDVSPGIDKSVLAVAAPRRYRNKDHLRFVTQQPCLLCGRKPSDAHHIRFMQPRALGRKPSDEYVVPLCRSHHRAVHRVGDEQAWWTRTGIDPIKVARKLWKHSRMDDGRIDREPMEQGAAPDRASATDGDADSGISRPP